MRKLFPCLNFNGNAEEAFTFYKSVFGGEFSALQRWKEIPDAEKIPVGDREKIMHIALPIGNSEILIASDSPEFFGAPLRSGNNSYIVLDCESKAEADTLFAGLSVSGKIEMGMHDAFWGAYFGQFSDKFGIQWMIICHHCQIEMSID